MTWHLYTTVHQTFVELRDRQTGACIELVPFHRHAEALVYALTRCRST